MDAPYQAAPDVHVYPANLPIRGVGVLGVNAYLLMAEEPVLIDTGIGVDGDDFIAAVSSIVDPQKLKWVWLTRPHADLDRDAPAQAHHRGTGDHATRRPWRG